eukprot:scaffold12202_cov61-Phaeocystis_antarctica.AAC.4
MPRLRWQDSLLIELHHTYSRRDAARLLRPACDGRTCAAYRTASHLLAALAAEMRAASHTYSRVGCAARFPGLACDGRARRSDVCRITSLLA